MLEVVDRKVPSIGYEVALSVTLPLAAGFQIQVATSAVVDTLMQPGILLPFAVKVTFPSPPALAIVAVIVLSLIHI